MGNTESIPPNYGFQVIEILDQSPGAKSGLILETDFVLTVNGKKLRKMTPETIKGLVQENEDKEILLKVYNNAADQVRDVLLTPSRNWPGNGLLGIKIRLAPFGDLKHIHMNAADPNFSYDDVYLNEKRPSSIGERSNVFKTNHNNTVESKGDEGMGSSKKSFFKSTMKALGMKK